MVLVLKVCSSRSSSTTTTTGRSGSRYLDGDGNEEEIGMSPQSMIPGIKLFGTKIPAPECQIPIEPGSGFHAPEKSQFKVACSTVSNTSSDPCAKSKNLETGGASKARVGPQAEESQAGKGSHEQEKAFKKPDKILPCPRCNSFQTKFCYFNNYNVNQPRHFCKNCQRYWTAGGAMRNVPVGAGRRKNKQFASSQYRQALMSLNGMVPPNSGLEAPHSSNHHLVSPSEFASPLGLTHTDARGSTVFKFGPEAPLSASMDNVLNLGDQHRSCVRDPVSFSENREEPSSASEPETNSSGSCDSNLNPHQQISALFFPYHQVWQNLSAATAGAYSNHFPLEQDSIQWGAPPVVAIPGICPQPAIPLQIVHAPYMGCIPLALMNGSVPPSTSSVNNISCLRSGFQMLGKHSRDGDMGAPERSDSNVLVPKTLRIDNLNEASRSPIWTALGIRPHERIADSKVNGNGCDSEEAAEIMEVNPAALSRSHTFQETS
ncbi:hypothetical protein SAY87_017656 [Trapa incisa]|uniref:Dof-type domain-containing protein n=1 Tax=Trapa incisa TaxID=236973 RepID=A0AAN7QS30_9MYRT|nr:hypothetical protein SAY87_017656 [Trapa incisa]